VEREQERDEYHAKIQQLEGLVKDRDRKDGVTQRLTTEVCSITLASVTLIVISSPADASYCIMSVVVLLVFFAF